MEVTKEFLLKLFEKTDEILKSRGIVGEIVLFGGSALIFSFDKRVFTMDIDAYIAPKEEVIKAMLEATEMIVHQKPKESWISTEVLKYIYTRFPENLDLIYDGENLRVFKPDEKYLLAMKIFAAREEKDFEDALMIARKLGIKTERDLKEVYFSVFPAFYLDEKRKAFIKDIIEVLKNKT